MSFLPQDKESLIRLAREKEEKFIIAKLDRYQERDGEGWRYLVPQMYLFANNSFEAAHAYERFERDYPDDIGSPCLFLTASLAFFRENRLEKASKLLFDLLFLNLYFLPYLLGDEVKRRDIWHGSTVADIDYIEDVDKRVFTSWNKKEKSFAKTVYDSVRYQFIQQQYIAIGYELKKEKDFQKRSILVEQERILRKI